MPLVDSSHDYPSCDKYGDNHFLTIRTIDYFFEHYTNHQYDLKDPYCLPMNAKALTELPPAIIAVAECDPLHDEGVSYANQLKDAGNNVTLLDFHGLYHGFLGHIDSSHFARQALNRIIDAYSGCKHQI